MDLESAYTSLLKRHRHSVWTMCWRYAGGDPDRCGDLVQEVSLSLWQHFGKLREDASPFEERAWVLWHTRSVLSHLHRSHRPQHLPLTPDMTEHLAVDDTGTRLHEAADELLATLDDGDRRLVQLRLKGYKADEIAKETGSTRDAVYQRLHRIVKQLRDKYGYER